MTGPKKVLGALGLLAVFLALWWMTGPLFKVPRFILPPPSDVLKEFWLAASSGGLMRHTWITFIEILLGFVAGSLLGVIIGYSLSFSRTLEMLISPYILALQI